MKNDHGRTNEQGGESGARIVLVEDMQETYTSSNRPFKLVTPHMNL
jgi:hypothetical protein